MKRLIIGIIFTCAFIFVVAPHIIANDKPLVFVSIVPQKYFVQQIGKDLVDISVMVQPGADPHTYEPKPRQMIDLSKTKIYFAIGVSFENAWLDKIAAVNPDMRVVHTDHGIEKLAMAAHHHHDDADEHHENEHHGEAEHDKNHNEHAGLDPHIWLSPPLVKIQARTILTALQEADPEHRSVYEANFEAFTAQIDQLDAELKKTFAGKTGLQFMVFHPAWGYFAHAYGLKQVPIEIEGKNPKPAQLKELIEHAKEREIRVVFVQPQFSTKSAQLVTREIGGQVAFADPLAEDWIANLRQIADKFQAALK
jgi:zinc transport system substrate-binding protein